MGRSYHALLIGNGLFKPDSGLDNLHGPALDLQALKRALTDDARGLHPPENVQVLLDGTKTEILFAMERCLSRAGRDDQVVLYYSGHGRLTPYGDLILCASDTETDYSIASSVSAHDVNEIIRQARVRTVIVVLDCCYAGAFLFKGEGFAASLGGELGEGRYVIASVRASQRAPDGQAGSPFSCTFADALLNDRADLDGDGLMSVEDVYRFIRGELKTQQLPLPTFSGETRSTFPVLARRSKGSVLPDFTRASDTPMPAPMAALQPFRELAPRSQWALATTKRSDLFLSCSELLLLAVRLSEPTFPIRKLHVSSVRRTLEDAVDAAQEFARGTDLIAVRTCLFRLLERSLVASAEGRQLATELSVGADVPNDAGVSDEVWQLQRMCTMLAPIEHWGSTRSSETTRLPVLPDVFGGYEQTRDSKILRRLVLSLGGLILVVLSASLFVGLNIAVAGACAAVSVPIALLWWALATVRGERRLQADLLELVTTASDAVRPDRREEILRVAEVWSRGVEVLSRRTGRAGPFLKLPWCLMLGPAGAGKTTILRLCLPDLLPEHDSIKGPGDMRWYLNTAALVIDATNADRNEQTYAFLRAARRRRGKRAISSLVVVIGVDALLNADELALDSLGKTIRGEIDELRRVVDRVPPVIFLLTKADLLAGFCTFWDTLRKSDYIHPFGRRVPDGPEAPRSRFSDTYAELSRELRARALHLFEHEANLSARRAILEHLVAFEGFRYPLEHVVGAVLPGTSSMEIPLLGGFYFASGKQESTVRRTIRTRMEQAVEFEPPVEHVHTPHSFFVKIQRPVLSGYDD